MPERKFSKEDIVGAAFNVTRKYGWIKCSARMIAKELGSSTMPIYSALASMNHLKDEIILMANHLLLEYQTKRRTSRGFLDMGVGYVLFAQEEKNLFRMMYFGESDAAEGPGAAEQYQGFVLNTLLDRLADEEVLSGLSAEKRKELLFKMWVFSHGLAVLSNNAVIGPLTEEEITNFLMDTGFLIISGEKSRSFKRE